MVLPGENSCLCAYESSRKDAFQPTLTTFNECHFFPQMSEFSWQPVSTAAASNEDSNTRTFQRTISAQVMSHCHLSSIVPNTKLWLWSITTTDGAKCINVHKRKTALKFHHKMASMNAICLWKSPKKTCFQIIPWLLGHFEVEVICDCWIFFFFFSLQDTLAEATALLTEFEAQDPQDMDVSTSATTGSGALDSGWVCKN